MSIECKCQRCRNACARKPGWMVPGDAERIAKFLGVTLEELFKTKLMIDWWEGRPNVFVLSPAVTDEIPGKEFQANPSGRCVFYKKGLCSIHAVKPFECRESAHDRLKNKDGKRWNETAADAWRYPKHQAQIVKLLGRKPRASEYNAFDPLLWR